MEKEEEEEEGKEDTLDGYSLDGDSDSLDKDSLDEDEGKYLYVLHPEGGDSEVPNYPRVCLMLPGDVPEGEAWVQVKATDPDWDVSAE